MRAGRLAGLAQPAGEEGEGKERKGERAPLLPF